MKTFKVEYCENCDGGKQEYNTARSAILAVHPGAKIQERKLRKRPIVVNVYVSGIAEPIFSAEQQELFSKYPERRKASVEAIMKAVGNH